MLKSARSVIRLRGVRHNNLKNFDLDLPLNRLIVISGLSGSGKSSLAFDTLFAEGQRRYIETFSPYARQFLDRMDKPAVDSIEGIPPAIAIEQRNAVRTTRSTVGTMTEICDYMKMLWPQIAQLYCRQCGRPVRKDSPQAIRDEIRRQRQAPEDAGGEFLITFDLPLTERLTLAESLVLVSKQGYQRLLFNGQLIRLEEAQTQIPRTQTNLTILQDRLNPANANRARFIEACEQAYHFGKGKLTVWKFQPPASISDPRPFSKGLHCAQCDLPYQPPSPALFSFNHPVGACPTCRGFGRIISIDYNLALPDRSRTLAQGVVKPWQSGMSAECQTDLMRTCRHFEIPTNVPFEKLPGKWQDFVINGEPDYGKDEDHQWPRAWYGIKGYFRWLESKSYKMHVRVLLSRYRAYTPCPVCHGARFQPETLLYRVGGRQAEDKRQATGDGNQKTEAGGQEGENGRQKAQDRRKKIEDGSGEPAGLTLADFYRLPIRDAVKFIDELRTGPSPQQRSSNDPLRLVLGEVRSRLGYLDQVGLGYLTLDRPTRSLSGGETERVNLTTCLGTRLVNTLFVLDEPSVGLHPRDTERLVRILEQLRDAGNTVVVVEHEPSVIRAADQIVDLGPGHGATGGQVVFQGTCADLLKCDRSLTGDYLSGRKQIEVPARRLVAMDAKTAASQAAVAAGSRGLDARAFSDELILKEAPAPFRIESSNPPWRPLVGSGEERVWLTLSHATRNNLQDFSASIPLGRFVCVTGVSGSGKTTLVREVLLPALTAKLRLNSSVAKASDRLNPEPDDQEDDSPQLESSGTLPDEPQLEGCEGINRVILVDQSILGKTPRSNPAVYIGAFDEVREFFAQSESARQRGLNASAFSFNSSQGQCERCRGAGFEKIEMQFLSDVFIRCPDCNGRRYRSHILEVRLKPESSKTPGAPDRLAPGAPRGRGSASPRSLSIADLLDSTIEEAIAFLAAFPDSRSAGRAVQSLNLLQEVGLGYLKLGQPINTLSGGESQRLKLVKHLAEAKETGASPADESASRRADAGNSTLFLFDEPTTGLHFHDVRLLLNVFQRLVDAGHSVVVIEHNLEVIKSADWIIDLGPDAGDRGGQLVAQGTPEDIAQCPTSHTGQALCTVLAHPRSATRSASRQSVTSQLPQPNV